MPASAGMWQLVWPQVMPTFRGRIGRSATVNTSKEKDNDVAEIGRLEAELKKAEDELGNIRQQLTRVRTTSGFSPHLSTSTSSLAS